ncbi:MAG TPA: FtsK/SpoIIIE domain-containing protein [Micromonosporaceae bacterium]
MARLRADLGRAAALHREAAAVTQVAARALDVAAPDLRAQEAEQRELSEQLRALAAKLAPGWLGEPLETLSTTTPLSGDSRVDEPVFLRIGVARPTDDAQFPVLVPLVGQGHLAFDADARDARVAAVLRAIVTRLLATMPPGRLRLRTVDTGAVFAPFQPLTVPVADRDGLRVVLADAEQWVREPGEGHYLLVVASLPELTEPADLARLAALAELGPAARLHLVVAGWPPPPLTADTARPPLAHTTPVAVRNPHVLVGDPPGASFGTSNVLNAPVLLDPEPPPAVVQAVCAQVAGRLGGQTVRLADLLPQRLWRESAAAGLSAVVGRAGNGPLTLRFNDATPHWLIGGRSGAGKTAFLINVLYGLATRYGPDQLALYLLDFKEGVSFTEFVPTPRDPTWIPQAVAVGVESEREYGLAVLRELDAEMTRRSTLFKDAGVTRFADLGEGRRIVCVIDEFQVLLDGSDHVAREAVALLENLARKGRSYGIHLVLASQTVRGVEALYAKRDSIFGQFPVRIALPGGGDVLDPLNHAAATITLGEAVVNTAGGLGGPNGAARAHERLVRFPDPHADPEELAGLRRRLWQARPAGSEPPCVFAGYAEQRLDDDPSYQSARPDSGTPAALLGRQVDIRLSTAAFPLDDTPGRHLAVLGTDPTGAAVLHAAGLSLARQRRPGSVRFALWSLVPAVDPLVDDLADTLAEAGHEVRRRPGGTVDDGTYLLVFGADGQPDVRPLLRDGPSRGVHVLAWWRGVRRFTEDVGGSAAARDDVAGMLFLNVPKTDVALLLGDVNVEWRPRPNRALLSDRHADRTTLIVPFADGRAQ